MSTADALRESLISPNVFDSNLEAANVVDAISALAQATGRVAERITATAVPGHDETGGTVASLTEAVMGITAGLCRIADSISDLAEVIREKGNA